MTPPNSVYGTARLTLYAIISAVEKDLREYIKNNILTQKSLTDIVSAELYESLELRAQRNNPDDMSTYSSKELLDYMDFSDSYKSINHNKQHIPEGDRRYFKNITIILEQLGNIRNRVMHGRPLLFDDLTTVTAFSRELVKSGRSYWPYLKEVRELIGNEPGYVLRLNPNISKRTDRIDNNLPIPDFDETGFLGRETEAQQLKSHLYGPYPVITVLGEGGIGKTALALQVAYDVLDDPYCPFDAIVWTSSKTTKLTPSDIIQIKSAVSNSIGVFDSIANQLGASSSDGEFTEIIEYLNEFKILLIIDNLETVLDERIRNFLHSLPQGSKVLITSRISVGAYDFPYQLTPMTEEDSIRLLRAVSQVRNVTPLTKASKTKLLNYCKRLKNNPGFIKWFVATVQAGKRPEDALVDPKIFLQFCLSNIYEHLGPGAELILASMISVPSRHSFAMLQYLTDLPPQDVESSLQELLASNFIRMETKEEETAYKLNELPGLYLRNYHMPKKTVYDNFVRRRNQIMSSSEEIKAASERNPYIRHNISISAPSHRVVAKRLQETLKFIKQGNTAAAEQNLTVAKTLSQDYYEVYRIEAHLRIAQENIPAGRSAYEMAIELAPEIAPLRLWYGGFLLRYARDPDAALEQFKAGRKIDAKAIEFELEEARSRMYLGQFSAANDLLSGLISHDDLSEWNAKKLKNLIFQTLAREAEQCVRQKEYVGAMERFEKLKQAYSDCPSPYLDDRNKQVIFKVVSCVKQAFFALKYMDDTDKYSKLVGWFTDFETWQSSKTTPEGVGRKRGFVCRLSSDKPFGFIRTSDGIEYFFHRNHLIDDWGWSLMEEGAGVTFSVGTNAQGECAVDVELRAN